MTDDKGDLATVVSDERGESSSTLCSQEKRKKKYAQIKSNQIKITCVSKYLVKRGKTKRKKKTRMNKTSEILLLLLLLVVMKLVCLLRNLLDTIK